MPGPYMDYDPMKEERLKKRLLRAGVKLEDINEGSENEL